MHSFATMIPITHHLLRNICFFLVLGLLPQQTLAQGKLALYLDFACSTPSSLEPSVSLPLSTCLVPVGAVSLAIQQFPKCDSGTASMIMYEDTSCALNTFSKSKSYTGWSSRDNCFYWLIGKSIPGVMFTCEEPATNPQPTSTSTVRASIIAGVATDDPATGSATGPADASKTTAASTGKTTASTGKTTATTQTGTGTGSTTTSTAGTSSDNASSSNSSGLGRSDKIAIGVGLGVGIPSIVIGFLAWFWPRKKS
ncbi:hypothetical protein QBC33DRAFT_176407 [Phialemonium atrogriseum]|uniref:Uncharacterized protein n=1 Tax=Phialemonium atrogriseum TaxID=1093897 RepID=A0AAJ0FKA6_9PEZI|nr:uncharacterized protein QBC33DRAFT_176407 [Phialemonium atrogriseum]KAK1765329.1 hypothetical protein QBC33DRAFT_176407 [Phialemonium atrogriseum]